MESQLQDWVGSVFGEAGASLCRADEATLLKLIEVFGSPAILAPVPDEVLNQAFWDLSSSALHAVSDAAIAWKVRHRSIRSFETLFRELFAARCTPTLAHRGEPGSPLNPACYMWWDFDCWVARSEPLTQNPLDAAFLESMRAILAIDHAACQESALHGLGHWHHAHSHAVEEIIDEYLDTRRPPELLREYAMQARCGCVQ